MGILLMALLFPFMSMAGYAPVTGAEPVISDADWLLYDNGTPAWVCWTGAYRGVWFDTEDFVPGVSGMEILECEIWFYHDSQHPWDTSSFFLELWEGDQLQGPQIIKDQSIASAFHFAPSYVNYGPPVAIGQNFWVLCNTSLSAGGWPSMLSDGYGTPDRLSSQWPHSYYFDSFGQRQPWGPQGPCNYFIRVQAALYDADLAGVTWAEVKTVF